MKGEVSAYLAVLSLCPSWLAGTSYATCGQLTLNKLLNNSDSDRNNCTVGARPTTR